MSDLIDRQAAIDLLKKSASRDVEEVVITKKNIKIIEDMPIAYDLEKVVAELEEEKFDMDNCRYDVDLNTTIDMAIAVVKRGGVE